MILSEKDKQNFLKMVCSGYRRVAKDLINEKIDALYIGYGFAGVSDVKKYGVLGIKIELPFQSSSRFFYYSPAKIFMQLVYS